MKILEIMKGVFSVTDQRGRFTVHNDRVIDLVDINGVVHLHIDDEPTNMVKNNSVLYDLDQSTGYPVLIQFGAWFDRELGSIVIKNNLRPTGIPTYYEYTANDMFVSCRPEYSLARGVTLKQFLMAVVYHLYPKHAHSFGLSSGFKLIKREHFAVTRWSDLTFNDIMDIYLAYEDQVSFKDVVANNDSNMTLFTEGRPFNGVIKANYRVVKISSVIHGAPHHIVVYDRAYANNPMSIEEYQSMFHDYFHSAPIQGQLVIGDKEYEVSHYISSPYQWDAQEFLDNFFSVVKCNQSIRRIINDLVIQVGRLEYEG